MSMKNIRVEIKELCWLIKPSSLLIIKTGHIAKVSSIDEREIALSMIKYQFIKGKDIM